MSAHAIIVTMRRTGGGFALLQDGVCLDISARVDGGSATARHDLRAAADGHLVSGDAPEIDFNPLAAGGAIIATCVKFDGRYFFDIAPGWGDVLPYFARKAADQD